MEKIVERKSCIFVILIWLLFSGICQAEVVEEVGEACDPDIKIAQEEALKQAKKTAIENYIGTLIDSRALVINSRLMQETIQTMAQGKARLLGKPSIISATPFPEKGFVCVKLKAKFEIDKRDLSRVNFGLNMLLNKKGFVAGDELKITLYAKERCYPYLFSVDAKGNVYRLLPNSIEDNPLIKGRFDFPTVKMKKKGIKLIVLPNPELKDKVQTEELIFVCTREQEDSLSQLFQEAFVANREDFKKSIKSFHHKAKELAQVLNKIGLANYEMMDVFYQVRREQ